MAGSICRCLRFAKIKNSVPIGVKKGYSIADVTVECDSAKQQTQGSDVRSCRGLRQAIVGAARTREGQSAYRDRLAFAYIRIRKSAHCAARAQIHGIATDNSG